MARIGQRSYTYGRKLNWVWRVQSDTAPSLATLTQIPTKDCKFLISLSDKYDVNLKQFPKYKLRLRRMLLHYSGRYAAYLHGF
jgi:hypothetical protein